MGITFVIDSVSHSGGTDRVVSTLASNFSDIGYDVTIHSIESGEPYYKVNDRVSVLTYDSNNRTKSLISIIKHEKDRNNTIIVISMGRLSVQFILLAKIYRLKSKLICSDHVSFNSFNKLIRMVKLFCYRLYDEVVTLTNVDKLKIKKITPNLKLTAIRNISPYCHLDNSDFTNIQNKKKIALAVGRLSYQKNFIRLIKLWAVSNTDGWQLQIVGSGPEEKNLLDYISIHNISNISIIEANKNIDEYYKNSSVLLMTSRYEGLPMVLIEAKNFGLPAIAFDCETGPAELITNDGFLIDYDDDNRFKVKLEEIITNTELRTSLSINALDNSTFFNSDQIISEWLKVIKNDG